MIRTLFFSLIILTISTTAYSQDSVEYGWDHDLKAGFNFTQVAFKDWSKGGSNSLAYVAQMIGVSNNEAIETKLANRYKLIFGQTKLEDVGMRKTDDEINLESMLTYKVGIYVNPYAAISAKSQFAPGYQYTDTLNTQTSDLLDPLYLTQSAGVGYEPAKWFKTRLGAALRETFTNVYNTYADDPTTPDVETTKIEGGLESVTEAQIPIEENVMFDTRLELFSAFKTFDKIVMNAQASLVLKASEWFNASLSANAINDWQVTPRTQFKESIALGISYTLF
ncbi:MAG TPA: DUF3078 domain-containing protein [Candidatus Kapabacteria bacterium]|nr:DUF3078 domain-containing protein [Candidatus Kapabacteria bacterium]